MSEEKDIDEEKNKRLMEMLKNDIIEHYLKGNVVFTTIDGLSVMPMDKFIEQPAEGILYDLNRLGEVILSWADEQRWINDYAASEVITALKNKIDKLEEQINNKPNKKELESFYEFIAGNGLLKESAAQYDTVSDYIKDTYGNEQQEDDNDAKRKNS